MPVQGITICAALLLSLSWGIYAAEQTLRVERDDAAKSGTNLLANPGFEQMKEGALDGWLWDGRNTDAAMTVVRDAHSGAQAVQIASNTEHAPHVYGSLRLATPLSLEAGKSYTLSVFCKSAGNPMANFAWGQAWEHRLNLKATGGKWARVSKTFTATDAAFVLHLIAEGPTRGFLVDDLKLEEGAAPTFFLPGDEPSATTIQLDLPPLMAANAPEFTQGFIVMAKEGDAAGELIVGNRNGEALVASRFPLQIGPNTLKLVWQLPTQMEDGYQLTIRAGAAKTIVPFTLITSEIITKKAQMVADVARVLSGEVTQARQNQRQVPQARAACAIAKRFIPIALQKYEVGRVAEAIGDLTFLAQLLQQNMLQLRRIVKGQLPDIAIPEPDLSKLAIRNGNFYAGDDPVMLMGAMGFGELKDDLGEYKDYGFNTIDGDFYSDAAFRMITGEDKSEPAAIAGLVKWWERFAGMNLANSFNPTLHYFPFWAMKKYPDITGDDVVDRLPDWSGRNQHAGKRVKSYGGFFPFAIDSQNLRRLVSRYYAELMPAIAKAPGFCTIWLMNEPTYKSRDTHYLELFRAYLRQKHGAIERVNELWRTSLNSFDEITADLTEKGPARFDWLTFHQDQVAGWFEWLAAEAKKHYPNAVLSNKPMAWTLLHPELGIDFEREARLWEVPGCDSGRSPDGGQEYSFEWTQGAMLFDFQKSVAPDKPLADHEYHYVHWPDVSAEYIRAAYFHSYLHGLRKSEFWYWSKGELNPTKNGGAGSADTAWSQPRVAWGTSTAAMDLRRLGKYIAPFPGRAQIMIYFSRPSLYVMQNSFSRSLGVVYKAANSLDAPVGFVTDRMIREGRLKECKLLLVPNAKNVEADVLAAIEAYRIGGGKIILLGESLKHDEYDRPHATSIDDKSGVEVLPFSKVAQLLQPLEQAAQAAGVERAVRCLNEDGNPAWPVECRSTVVEGKTVVYLIGLNAQPQRVRLRTVRALKGWRDCIRGEAQKADVLEIKPLEIRLLELEF